jgi:hypothetical protein
MPWVIRTIRYRKPVPGTSAARRRETHGAVLPRQTRRRPSRTCCSNTWFFFTSNLGFPIIDSNILLTQQDIDDIIAFLKLIRSEQWVPDSRVRGAYVVVDR